MASKKINNAIPTRDWQVEEDMNCLQRAAEIKKDQKRMEKVKALAKQRLDELVQLSGETTNG